MIGVKNRVWSLPDLQLITSVFPTLLSQWESSCFLGVVSDGAWLWEAIVMAQQKIIMRLSHVEKV